MDGLSPDLVVLGFSWAVGVLVLLACAEGRWRMRRGQTLGGERFELDCVSAGLDPSRFPARERHALSFAGGPSRGTFTCERDGGRVWVTRASVSAGESDRTITWALVNAPDLRLPHLKAYVGVMDPTSRPALSRHLFGPLSRRWRVYTADATFAARLFEQLRDAPELDRIRIEAKGSWLGLQADGERPDLADLAPRVAARCAAAVEPGGACRWPGSRPPEAASSDRSVSSARTRAFEALVVLSGGIGAVFAIAWAFEDATHVSWGLAAAAAPALVVAWRWDHRPGWRVEVTTTAIQIDRPGKPHECVALKDAAGVRLGRPGPAVALHDGSERALPADLHPWQARLIARWAGLPVPQVR